MLRTLASLFAVWHVVAVQAATASCASFSLSSVPAAVLSYCSSHYPLPTVTSTVEVDTTVTISSITTSTQLFVPTETFVVDLYIPTNSTAATTANSTSASAQRKVRQGDAAAPAALLAHAPEHIQTLCSCVETAPTVTVTSVNTITTTTTSISYFNTVSTFSTTITATVHDPYGCTNPQQLAGLVDDNQWACGESARSHDGACKCITWADDPSQGRCASTSNIGSCDVNCKSDADCGAGHFCDSLTGCYAGFGVCYEIDPKCALPVYTPPA